MAPKQLIVLLYFHPTLDATGDLRFMQKMRDARERAESRPSRQLKNDHLLSRILACIF
jgi:hypothetical protein